MKTEKLYEMPRRAALAAGILVLALGFLPVRSAHAFDGQAWAPAVDPQGYWSVYSSRTAPKGRGYIGFWYSYAHNPFHLEVGQNPEEIPGLLGSALTPVTSGLAEPTDPLDPATTPILCGLAPILDPLANPAFDPLVDCPGGVGGKVDLIKDLHTGDFVASYSLTDWFEVGIDVPVSYVESDIPGVNEGVDIDNIRLNGKLQIIDAGTGGFGLALVPFVELPTGNADHLTANGDIGGGALAVAEFVANRFRMSLNGGYAIKDKPFDNDDETDEIPFGLGLGFLVLGNQPILGAKENRLELIGEIFGATAAQHDPFQDEFSTPTEWLAGGKWYGGNGLLAGLAGGTKVTDGINSPDYRIVATVGYTWQPEPPPPAPPPPPPPAKVVVTEEQIITLEPIYFDFDKSTIKPVSEPVLQDIVKVMNERPTIRVRVESHTDSKGSDAYNQKLSERRANSTVQWLIKHGIDPSRLESVGYGESRPIATNDTDAGRAKNRRSEFHVITPGQG